MWHICRIMAKKKFPMNAHQIADALMEEGIESNERSIKTYLAETKLFNRDKHKCCECGNWRTYYTTSDIGKMEYRLADAPVAPRIY